MKNFFLYLKKTFVRLKSRFGFQQSIFNQFKHNITNSKHCAYCNLKIFDLRVFAKKWNFFKATKKTFSMPISQKTHECFLLGNLVLGQPFGVRISFFSLFLLFSNVLKCRVFDFLIFIVHLGTQLFYLNFYQQKYGIEFVLQVVFNRIAVRKIEKQPRLIFGKFLFI